MRATILRCLFLAMACAVAAAARQKVAVINAREAILDTAEGRSAAHSLEEKFRGPMQRLEMRRTDKDTPAYRREMEDMRQQVETERTRMVDDLAKKLHGVLVKYAERKHYEAVLDVSDPNSPVMWFKKGNDITRQIVAEYDRAYPREASAP